MRVGYRNVFNRRVCLRSFSASRLEMDLNGSAGKLSICCVDSRTSSIFYLEWNIIVVTFFLYLSDRDEISSTVVIMELTAEESHGDF